MNTSIRKVAAAIGVLLVALFVNLNYVQVVKGSDYRNAPGNRRVLLNEYASPRGAITLSDGTTIASSKATKDELKYLRIYPDGSVYAPLTGFYSISATPSRYLGTEGIEAYEDAVLSGNDPRLFGRRLADLLTGRNPRGGNIELTIDSSAQQTAYDELTQAHLKGAVVALDPRSGAILAAVSTPSYNPNELSSHDVDANSSAYSAYCRPNAVGNCTNSDQPLLNRDFNQLYFPGSIFKIVVSATALKAGYKPSTVVSAPNGYLPTTGTNVSSCKGDVINCVENFEGETCDNGHTATLAFAFAKSCNTAFSELVDDNLDPTALAGEAKLFGFDPSSQLTIPMGVANSTLGPPGDLLDRGKLAHMAFGQQSVQVTPLQAAMLSAAVANGGVLMKPYVVNREVAPDLSVLSKTAPSQLSQVLSGDQDQELQAMMEGVVSQSEGTAFNRFPGITGYTIGAKTGTADVGATSASNLAPDAWFTGYAIQQSTGLPRIAVAVILEGASTGNESAGGRLAGPIARDVMAAYLKANPSS
jgi:peptidoglycan glycosyltransferase